ncbi:MAG: DUF2281 domain-containing protein [Anaerolineales bacterium]|nr:DUF2281 domain-containing protein [Anaerolineales bacterium]
MAIPRIVRDINSLPPEVQRQVFDFVAFLQDRYASAPAKKSRRAKLIKEPFIGMWKDRPDMKDSVDWVRKVRRDQWRSRA